MEREKQRAQSPTQTAMRREPSAENYKEPNTERRAQTAERRDPSKKNLSAQRRATNRSRVHKPWSASDGWLCARLENADSQAQRAEASREQRHKHRDLSAETGAGKEKPTDSSEDVRAQRGRYKEPQRAECSEASAIELSASGARNAERKDSSADGPAQRAKCREPQRERRERNTES